MRKHSNQINNSIFKDYLEHLEISRDITKTILHWLDRVYFIKYVINSITFIKTKSRKTLILRDLLFKSVVPPASLKFDMFERKSLYNDLIFT
jgi:hypothetical protein